MARIATKPVRDCRKRHERSHGSETISELRCEHWYIVPASLRIITKTLLDLRIAQISQHLEHLQEQFEKLDSCLHHTLTCNDYFQVCEYVTTAGL